MSILDSFVFMMEEEEKLWSKNVTEKAKYHPPEGLFTKSGETIAKTLLDDSDSPGQAMKRLTFYMNRAGENLENKAELEKAKDIIAGKEG